MRFSRRLRAVVLAVGVAVVATGCQASVSSLTLPGGATSKDVFGSKPTNTYTVYFSDALDLVPQASVRMNDVDIGDVRSISLVHNLAMVKIRVLKSVTVPANATGILSQTSLLGEKYVNLAVANGDAAQGVLPAGSTIPADKTSDELQAEDVFGALSELLNGGGLQQIQGISVELTQALSGRENNVRDLLSQLTTLATSLDGHRTEIVRALNSVNTLAKTLVNQEGVIKEALSDIAPGLKALDDTRSGLKSLVTGLDKLSTIAVDFENKTKADTVRDLNLLAPTLDRLNQAGGDIVGSLQLLLTYPFGDNALKAIFSDYTGLDVSLNIDLRNGAPGNPIGPSGLCATVSNSVADQSLCTVLGNIESVLPTGGNLPGGLSTTTGQSGLTKKSGSSGSSGSSAEPTASPSKAPVVTLPGAAASLLPSTGSGTAATPSPSTVSGVVGGVVGGLTGGSK